MDNKQATGTLDSQMINLNKVYKVSYWSKELGVTKEKLQGAVTSVKRRTYAVV